MPSIDQRLAAAIRRVAATVSASAAAPGTPRFARGSAG
jgi:hypothetical protein